jgi:Methionyl-tRNA formyltransferase
MNAYIPALIIDCVFNGHEVRWAHEAAELPEGDVCFYLSYGKIVSSKLLATHTNNLVVHESDLPKGRGWSPLTWQVLEGLSRIPVTLFEAAKSVDGGDIYLQEWIELEGNELVDDLRSLQANATINLCKQFIREYPEILKSARPQVGEATYYPRRRPVDSQIDLDQTIREQFNVFRVADNDNYPVFFGVENSTFILKVYSLEEIEHYGQ